MTMQVYPIEKHVYLAELSGFVDQSQLTEQYTRLGALPRVDYILVDVVEMMLAHLDTFRTPTIQQMRADLLRRPDLRRLIYIMDPRHPLTKMLMRDCAGWGLSEKVGVAGSRAAGLSLLEARLAVAG